MSKSVTIFIVVIIVLTAAYFYTRNGVQQNTPQPTPIAVSPTTASLSYCLPQALQASLTLEPAAGNIYGTFTIKNTSKETCLISGSNFIEAAYDKSIQNIAVANMGSLESATFQMSPNKTIYSQVHYPNGPQCSSVTKSAKVGFSYAVSPERSVEFVDANGSKEQNITICDSSDITRIQLWNWSAKPITQ